MFLIKAAELKPQLIEAIFRPIDVVEIVPDKTAFQGWGVKHKKAVDDLLNQDNRNNDSFILDFGTHIVGYLSLKISPAGTKQDSPLKLKLTLGEMPYEIVADEKKYHGWLSSSWLQHEIIYIDYIPTIVKLPRRYAFRYVKIEILGCNTNYRVTFEDIFCTSVTSADISKVKPLPTDTDDFIKNIDEVSIRTLQNCMQLVFEDGPKRDRRLWIGDLRLQAIANYETFNNVDLVKRCIYYFAGLTLPNGRVSCCIFTEPTPRNDDWELLDYSLFFVSVLYDYYIHTNDIEFVKEHWQVVLRQTEIAMEYFDKNGLIKNQACFIDWCPELCKQASLQGVVIYTFKQAKKLAEKIGDKTSANKLEKMIELYEDVVKRVLFDQKKGLFVSGDSRQISWASQVWLVLAEVFDTEKNGKILDSLIELSPPINMHTPYMWHHFIQALINSNRKEKAMFYIRKYWGGMVEKGADCFFEAYNPHDDFESPYDDCVINSYCHAWSCTPTYFIRKIAKNNIL